MIFFLLIVNCRDLPEDVTLHLHLVERQTDALVIVCACLQAFCQTRYDVTVSGSIPVDFISNMTLSDVMRKFITCCTFSKKGKSVKLKVHSHWNISLIAFEVYLYYTKTATRPMANSFINSAENCFQWRFNSVSLVIYSHAFLTVLTWHLLVRLRV